MAYSRLSPVIDTFSHPPCLADQILGCYASGVFENKPQDFLPCHCIDKLITKEAILEEFGIDDEPTPEETYLNTFILQHARKTFATAIICGIGGNDLYQVMKRFQDDNFTDEFLPVNKETTDRLQCFQPTRGRDKSWTLLRNRDFLEKQFIFLAPVFSKSVFKMNLEPGHIFPFIEKSSEAKEGTFSHVHRVTIHDSHQLDLKLNVKAPIYQNYISFYLVTSQALNRLT